MNQSDLADIVATQIISTIETEEASLKQIGKSIFSMPELVLSYLVGKSLVYKLNQQVEFDSVTWEQERSLGASGPCDLVLLKGTTPICVVEFKMRNTDDGYMSDVTKLALLPSGTLKIFCALFDAFTSVGEKDGRILRLEDRMQQAKLVVNRIGKWNNFTTKHGLSPRACVVAVWEINMPKL